MRRDNAVQIEMATVLLPQVLPILHSYKKDETAKELASYSKTYGNRTLTLSIQDFEPTLLLELAAVFTEDKQSRSMLRAYAAILSDPKAIIKKLELLPDAIYKYLVVDAIDGWVYEEVMDGVHVAYIVRSVEFHPARDSRSDDYVQLSLRANKAEYEGEERQGHDDGLLDRYINFERGDLRAGAGVILLSKGILKETAELKEAYLRDAALFEQYRPMEGKQFLCTNTALEVSKDSWWRREQRYSLPHATKMVNDEEILGRKITVNTTNYHMERYGIKSKSDKFTKIPIHPFILFFDLVRHTNCWIHVGNCTPYVYDPSLKDKLVLPRIHRELIDVLTTDMDVFVEDIIEGKSGGTAILCYGAPGLGKTLTAEVYSEVVGRPLYRVHAGQLGTSVSDVENELERILRRSERWGAILLLDEADVYIRQRSNDMDHNAVVAAFLRTLEYFHGLLFMTTNRANDVDDAIASRMVAMFKYETPDVEQASEIWRILALQFGIKISSKAIAELVKVFPEASGRDIKQLLKLTMKYCKHKGVPLSIEAFKVCAMFRGIV